VGEHELNMSLDDFKNDYLRGGLIEYVMFVNCIDVDWKHLNSLICHSRSSLTFLVEHKDEHDQLLVFFTEDETVGIKPIKK
jgi:DNA-directed RNA polymerase I, II, and III subunit RPABC1